MLEFITSHWLLLVCLFIYIISAILLFDISYWELEQMFVHWKKEQGFGKKANKRAIRVKFDEEYSLKTATLYSIIPIINTFTYIYVVILNMKESFKFSGVFILQDICKWEKGINAFIWKWWKPSLSWRIKYPII